MRKFRAVVLCFFVYAGQANAGAYSSKFDGHWWLKLDDLAKTSFINGESDCYIYEVKGIRYPDDPVESAAKEVDSYYYAHKRHRNKNILKVFREKFKYNPSHHPLEKYAENYGERHGGADGDYWWESQGEERLYFVTGYLACKETYLGSKIEQTPEDYVGQVSNWYHVSGQNGSGPINEKTRYDKIGNVLDSLLKK